MSLHVINEVLRRSITKGAARVCLLVLAHHCHDNGENCYPSLGKLSKEVGVSVSQVCKILNRLEYDKEIQRDRSTGGCNRRTQYRLSKYAKPAIESDKISNTLFGTTVVDESVDSVRSDTVNSVTHNTRKKPPDKCHSKSYARSKPKTAFPHDFLVTEEIRLWAEVNQLPCPDKQLEPFRDYHLSKGNVFSDWTAAFRSWLRKAKEFGSNSDTQKLKAEKQRDRTREFLEVKL